MRTSPETPLWPPATLRMTQRLPSLRRLAALALALQISTVLPVPVPTRAAATTDDTSTGAPHVAAAPPWFLLVGAALATLGALLALVDWALMPVVARGRARGVAARHPDVADRDAPSGWMRRLP